MTAARPVGRSYGFSPAPFTPGARIAWTHVLPDGSKVRRRGTVWSLAPVCHGGPTVWVTPDETRTYDRYPMVVVSRVRMGHVHVCGSVVNGAWMPGSFREFGEGEAFSEAHELSQTGALAAGAAAWQARHRSAHGLAA
jgi:hypothetical protein